ncbi:hypothetical protein AVEN_233085-1 [Araneus ventricosus]|uniref:Uncharacterized protein n=1 Tax=Araneus ventricosus TaxID=182803 RepID=A0A4Y2IGQ4_ARAVE|nr:hypothetical protein AVEN_233085-1 [Araneus ventricosus]
MVTLRLQKRDLSSSQENVATNYHELQKQSVSTLWFHSRHKVCQLDNIAFLASYRIMIFHVVVDEMSLKLMECDRIMVKHYIEGNLTKKEITAKYTLMVVSELSSPIALDSSQVT